MLVVAFILWDAHGHHMGNVRVVCRPTPGGNRVHLSVLIYACSYLSTVLIVDKHVSAIVAFAAGNWIGTYLTVKWMKK